ncbi:c-type cytochrome biogenesis protein CcmI [Halomonas pacifica]|uniref:C-type cytochrome biogenesis protein CcmI n=1 Tax=Halomonas salipaludis TaxID=2032625 RepID=A0A2A2ERF9_9GAMM|nr:MULTISPECIES: c-type cytochrome biogenesis protein CcmI [Halomonas]MDC8802706.1 c-type cytochrome biogenesis protein CcmI [Halomonas pacifica]PAU74985.1 c-type cytochrome biogenesis protein CcmI [Halomonas salipaludis]
MNLLWLGIALLLLPALWLVILPLRRTRPLHDAQQAFETKQRTDAQNVAVYRQRLASLETAHARGELDTARVEEGRLELERSLLEDTQVRRRTPLNPPQAGRLLVPLVMVALVVASLLWYQREGAEGDLALYAVHQEVRNSPDGSLAMLIERLEEQAKRQPDNPKVWMSLFPLYRDSNRGRDAIAALERLIELEGRQPSLLAQLAQIQFFVANRSLTDEVQALVDETLGQDPRQPTVLGMLGIHAFDRARYEEAIDYWRRAIAGFDDPGSAEALREGIAVAQQRLDASSDQVDAHQAAQDGASLAVRVGLAESLRERAAPGDTVFVIARDVAGELPPLAVERVTVSDLPLKVTLGDNNAMTPRARLSQVNEVRLTARVSASDEATPQPGDLVGEAGPVTLGESDSPVEISIDRIVD